MMAEKVNKNDSPEGCDGAASPIVAALPSQEQCLRVIGQDLEERGIVSFSLCFAPDHYAVREHAREKFPQRSAGGRWWFAARPIEALPQPPIELQYSHEDIERLEQLGRGKRGLASASPDFFGLSEQLRALGSLIDHKHARLLRLDRHVSQASTVSLAVEILTADGKRFAEQYSSSQLYDFCVRMYKTRKRVARQISPADAI
jgi:hypothetical protein